MPIEGRRPEECFEQFREHVAKLVTQVVPTQCPVRLDAHTKYPDRRLLRFANDEHDDAVELATRDGGSVFLHLSQTLVAKKLEPRRFQLSTVEYRYALYAQSPKLFDDAALRWEYVARSEHGKRWCRNHIQFGKAGSAAVMLSLGSGFTNLRQLHFPSGWVLMEEVFRFLIHELGVKPPCREEWDRVLLESEKTFEERFSRKSIGPR